jgi:ornithine cyclodeaminase/alanine dehydrogenase-like protein (mu-crystallin family)
MIVLSSDSINQLIPNIDVINAVEQAMVSMEKNECMVPARMHLDWDMNTYLVMPSISQKFYGTKLVSIFPQNKGNDMPVTNGVMVLNDKMTGKPIALINAAKLTALRTGAIGALGVKYLSDKEENSFGIIGYGVQGLQIALCTLKVRPIKTIFTIYHSEKGWHEFHDCIHNLYPSIIIVVCSTIEALMNSTNVIITATSSSIPVIPDHEHLVRGKCFIGVGSYKKSMQELPDAVYQLANQIFVDSIFGISETGDTLNPVKKGYITEEKIFTLGKIITKQVSVSFAETRVLKSSGMALFDLFLAEELYKKALELSLGNEIDI